MSSFKQTEFNKRVMLSQKIISGHPESVPVIISSTGSNKIELTKTKFIIPKELPVGSFIQQLRGNISLKSQDTIFLFCNDNFLIPTSHNFDSIYQKYKDSDGFLYLTVMKENTFGGVF